MVTGMSEFRYVRRVRRGLRLVMAVLALGALAGCTDGEAVDPPTFGPYTAPVTPTPTITPTPTPTPGVAGGLQRPDLSRVDEATAEALAKYYLDSYVRAHETGDVSEVRAFAHPECTFCADVISRVEEYAVAGEYTSGGELEYSDVTVTQISDSYFDVVFWATQSDMHVHDSTGAVVASYEPKRHHMGVGVLHENGEWRIYGVDTNIDD